MWIQTRIKKIGYDIFSHSRACSYTRGRLYSSLFKFLNSLAKEERFSLLFRTFIFEWTVLNSPNLCPVPSLSDHPAPIIFSKCTFTDMQEQTLPMRPDDRKQVTSTTGNSITERWGSSSHEWQVRHTVSDIVRNCYAEFPASSQNKLPQLYMKIVYLAESMLPAPETWELRVLPN